MLILPPGHAQTVRIPRRFRAREKWMIGGVLGTVAALIVVVAISFATPGHRSANGCVDITIPYATGGEELYRCGAQARALCRLAGVRGGYTGVVGSTLATECHKAGLPAGT